MATDLCQAKVDFQALAHPAPSSSESRLSCSAALAVSSALAALLCVTLSIWLTARLIWSIPDFARLRQWPFRRPTRPPFGCG